MTAVAIPLKFRRPAESAARRSLRRFVRHRAALAGFVILVVLVCSVIFVPLIYTADPNVTNTAIRFQAPSAAHPLGTDSLGRDNLARLLYAGRVSLSVCLSAAILATGLGLLLGAIAGMFGGWIDGALMRLADVVLALPLLIITSVVISIIGTGVEIIILAIGLFGWPEPARIVRAQILSLREQDFVTAAKALGATNGRILRRHLIVHALGPLTVTGTFLVAGALLTEAALSYLGIGVKPPQPSWGNMLTDAQDLFTLRRYPWYWIPPGLAIFATVLAINLVGDGLRDALDPRD
jgi:peptide/nickel transport system permease protein